MSLVIYLDMDCFFAACEELRHPEIKDKPVVVGTADKEHKERGVVESCNYQARKFGIHSAMAVSKAITLNKGIEYIKGDHDYYESISESIMSLVKKYGIKTEVISVDEAAIDLGDLSYDDASKIAREIKEKINKEIGLPCTVSVSFGKIFAKMACDSAKPNGIMILKENQVKEFLAQKEIDNIPGVGGKTKERLTQININKISDLGHADPLALIDRLGAFGKELFLLANGIDNSRVEDNEDPLSISRERTLPNKTDKIDEMKETLTNLSDEIYKELKVKGIWFKTITAKVRYADFSDKIKSKSLDHYSDSNELMLSTSIFLIESMISKKIRIRKVGIRVSNFIEGKRQRRL